MNNLKNTFLKQLTASLTLGLLFLSACIEKEKFDTPTSRTQIEGVDEFPLDAQGEEYFLNRQYGSHCFANVDCLKDDSTATNLANEFSFKRGQLILKGPSLFQQSEDQLFKINEHLKIQGDLKVLRTLEEKSESDFHSFHTETSSYQFLNADALDSPTHKKAKILFQSRLGLPPHQFGDAGFCNLLEAENFISKSRSPWLPTTTDPSYDSNDSFSGYNSQTNSYIAETVVICGGLNLLNSHLTIEAKNVIFYNSHINVSADQDIPSGIKIITENLGYFGVNMIESNIINDQTGQKGSSVPTVEISVSQKVDVIASDSSPNNRFNEHAFYIFLGSQEVPSEPTATATDSDH